MSTVKRCDRCGAESDEGLTMRWWKMSVPTVDPEDFDPEDLDLCPECRDDLLNLATADGRRWATITIHGSDSVPHRELCVERGELEAWLRAGKS